MLDKGGHEKNLGIYVRTLKEFFIFYLLSYQTNPDKGGQCNFSKVKGVFI